MLKTVQIKQMVLVCGSLARQCKTICTTQLHPPQFCNTCLQQTIKLFNYGSGVSWRNIRHNCHGGGRNRRHICNRQRNRHTRGLRLWNPFPPWNLLRECGQRIIEGLQDSCLFQRCLSIFLQNHVPAINLNLNPTTPNPKICLRETNSHANRIGAKRANLRSNHADLPTGTVGPPVRIRSTAHTALLICSLDGHHQLHRRHHPVSADSEKMHEQIRKDHDGANLAVYCTHIFFTLSFIEHHKTTHMGARKFITTLKQGFGTHTMAQCSLKQNQQFATQHMHLTSTHLYMFFRQNFNKT